MSETKIIDFPAANIINNSNKINEIIEKEEIYPIIRCENCHEIFLISLDLDKREVILTCEKEGKKKKISVKNFFDNIKIYEDSNCCEFCKNKNLSQKYYLCKTCSNKIICKNCFEKHNKDDDIEKLNKLDSLYRKHFNQIESYCYICKEHKCSYCFPEHEEEHKNKEYFIRDKMIKKNKLDNFIKQFNNISENKKIIEKHINEVINELKKKIDLLLKLKN